MSILAGEKFQLKLLPSEQILLHEECEDNRSGRLLERFKDENVLYNPLIVAEYEGKYILIDGANRFEALKNMGCKTILAQLVDYKSQDVKLRSWYHFVNGISANELILFCKSNGFQLISAECPVKPVIKNEVSVIFTTGEKFIMKFSAVPEEMLKQLSVLNRFYENEYSYLRIDSDTDINDVSGLSNEEGMLVVFPEFTKDDIINISGFSQKLPAGISRHLIPNRVLHIKILIDALKTADNLDKRNEELEKYIQYKIDTKKVRLYREPILVFDE